MEVNQREDEIVLKLADKDIMISNIDTNQDEEQIKANKSSLFKWLNRPCIGSIHSDGVSIC